MAGTSAETRLLAQSPTDQDCIPPKRQPSFLSEAEETLTRLLQHIIFAGLFTLKLYALPLIYFGNILSRPRDFDKVSLILLGRSSGVHKSGEHKRITSESVLQRLLNRCHRMILTPFRMLWALYILGLAIEEQLKIVYNLLQGTIRLKRGGEAEASYLDPTLVSFDRNVDNSSPTGSETNNTQSDASVVYHAALVNGGTLDNILAAFEATDGPAKRFPDFSFVSPSKRAKKSHKRRNSGIQGTPSHLNPCRRSLGGSDGEFVPDVGPPLDGATLANEELRLVESRETGDLEQHAVGPKKPSERSSKTSVNSANVTSDNTKHARRLQSRQHSEQCSIFQSRQSQSRLPRRSVDGIQHKTLVRATSSEGQMSTVSTLTGSPLRRARAQRRLRKA